MARHRAGRPAIAGTGWQPSFSELDAAADAIAAALTERNGAGAGRIALLLDHDAPLIAAMLGVLRAGQAMVVLNPTDPPGRLDRIRRQVQPDLVLTDERHRDLAQRSGFERVLQAPGAPAASLAAAELRIEPDALAAVIYTSGSTGRPKGVMHSHHTLLHTALRHSTALGLRPDDRVALVASPSGGHGMGTTWMTLMSGATLCPFPVMDRGVAGLPEWLREHRITVLGLSASLFRRLLGALDGASFPDLRLVRLGSEQVRRADFDGCRRHFGEHCAFANVLSLTEAGGLAHCLLAAGEEPRPGPLPVGRAAEGIEIQLLDERGEPVPAGQPGEIVVQSLHLTPGYWRDEALTAERLASRRDGQRILRTGDLGRVDEDGNLIVVGRRDAQVKIRGYRVELSEVEAALRSLPQLTAASAQAEPTRHGDPRLVAYVVARPGSTPEPAELRDALRATLSEASIPTAFAFLDQLPLNAHGKVDRDRLSAHSRPAFAAGASTPPSSDLERSLSEIWAEALELERVGRDDDFFDLGGDSLTAAEIGAGVLDRLGVEIDMRAFSRRPTVAGLAALIGQSRTAGPSTGPPLERVSRDAPLPCSFAQERTWRFARSAGQPEIYTMANLTRLRGPIDLDALRAALDHVVARHEPLRTTFVERDGRPQQVVHPAAALEVPLIDASQATDPEDSALDLLREEADRPFDLARGPLLRFRIVRLGEGDHRLLRISHHLITDRQSWRIFFAELAIAYEAIRRGETPAMDEDRLQYADFAVWERRLLNPEGSRYREQVAWWRHALDPSPPPLRLPFARQTPTTGLPSSAGYLWWGIDPAVCEALDRLGRTAGATHYAVRLALFSALVACETGEDVLAIGAYVETRRLAETRSMFGYFTNLVTLVLPFDPRAPLRRWIAKVQSILVEAMARSDLPYEQLCDELRESGRTPPEVNAIFQVRPPMPALTFGKADETPPRSGPSAMPWGFSFVVDQGEESDRCAVAFDAHLHDPVAVREFVDRYAGLAEATAAKPDASLAGLHRALR
ncbi:MAG TPA: AMP-binding protein [Solirubrobacterales bacterium]|nr:AMP-binding protein [Solirubrobacterales bacterium]